MTYVLLRVIGLFTPLRATEREEALGMDVIQHGEEAYATGEGAILVMPDGDGRPRSRSPTRASGPRVGELGQPPLEEAALDLVAESASARS